MEGQRRAVIVGVNRCRTKKDLPALRYAERDATELAALLTDEAIGTFDPVDVTTLTGENATTAAIKERLRGIALSAGPEDVLLFYFAGHAMIPDWSRHGEPYLLTTDFDESKLTTDPDHSLRMRFLRRDIFEQFHGCSFLVLDCCHAGAYRATEGTEANTPRHTLLNSLGTYELQAGPHSSLLSCPDDAKARESQEFEHGLLTHHLLRALRGEAGHPERVTFADAAEFIARQDLDPEPLPCVQGWGTSAALTRPTLGVRGRAADTVTHAPSRLRIAPCANPLDRSVESMTDLLDRLFHHDLRRPAKPGEDHRTACVEWLRRATSATGAAVVGFHEAAAPTVTLAAGSVADEARHVLERLRPMALANSKRTLGHIADDDQGNQYFLVALRPGQTTAITTLFLVNPAAPFLDMGEPLATALRAAWSLNETGDPHQAEAEVITAVRESTGRLPLTIYRRCFESYRAALASLAVVFQPVVELAPNAQFIGIHSYEALARGTNDSRSAPVAMLELPYTWGDQFLIERDSVLARKAIQQYARAHETGPWSGNRPPGLSINVSVRALISDSYLDTLEQAIKQAGLGHGTVTLEISEGDPIKPARHEEWRPTPHEYFRRRLVDIAQRLHVHFAVDDFGVDHASLDRLALLRLAHIKVDRTILQHPGALDELELVVHIARDTLMQGTGPAARDVVVEGIDGTGHVTLEQLFHLGIKHIQGYITGDVDSSELRQLSTETRKKIASMVRGH